MEKKKVLIISHSYPPSNVPAVQRPYAVAKYLNKDEFDVTVVTCGNRDTFYGINQGFDPELPKVNLIKISSLLGTGAYSLRKSTTNVNKSLKNRLKASLFRVLSSIIVPDKGIFWYPKVRKYLLQKNLINDTDIVFTTSPSFSNHLIGKFVKEKNKNILWVSEFRDFHFIETAKRVTNLKQFINKKLELSVIKHSDKVSFVSYAIHDIYSKYYTKLNSKFGVVYNGFDMSDFKGLKIAKTQNNKLTIFYAGSFYRGVRSPIPLLKILDRLFETRRITANEIEIRIAGNFENELLNEIQNYKSYACINFIGKISRAKVFTHLVSADLLWLIVGNKTTHYTGVPIKFFEYLGARRPILNFAPSKSEPTRIILENKLGWNFDTTSFNLDQAVASFEQIITDYKTGVLSESLESKFIPEFDRKHQGVLFGKLFKDN